MSSKRRLKRAEVNLRIRDSGICRRWVGRNHRRVKSFYFCTIDGKTLYLRKTVKRKPVEYLQRDKKEMVKPCDRVSNGEIQPEEEGSSNALLVSPKSHRDRGEIRFFSDKVTHRGRDGDVPPYNFYRKHFL